MLVMTLPACCAGGDARPSRAPPMEVPVDKLKDLTNGEKVIVASAVVLLIDAFLPWYSVDVGPFGTYSRNGFQSPGAFWSLLAILIGIAMGAVVIVSRLELAELPDKLGNFTWGQVYMAAGIAAFALVVIKYLTENSFVGFGMWLGFLATAGLAVGGFLANQEAGQTTAGGPPPGPPPSA